ncbi:MAG: glycosyltransferase family 2 protein [Candidatus Pacebacteria bacterium]|nr:glycosyltransferase family 2 protein [Candidatus Paceibacterota bacterium]
MANEEHDFAPFIKALTEALDEAEGGCVYLVVDNASQDDTLKLCNTLSATDTRFVTVWAPENKNVVDAYLRGYREAYEKGHQSIIEMDAGLSHDPAQLQKFLDKLAAGYECVFGSRNMLGGSNAESPLRRRLLSRGGTFLANILLGTELTDMTSGYQGFTRKVVEQILGHKLRSRAHFYQTELRYLLRNRKWIEVPIHYRAPSPRISCKAVRNALACLIYYTGRRIRGKKDNI